MCWVTQWRPGVGDSGGWDGVSWVFSRNRLRKPSALRPSKDPWALTFLALELGATLGSLPWPPGRDLPPGLPGPLRDGPRRRKPGGLPCEPEALPWASGAPYPRCSRWGLSGPGAGR